MTTANNDTKQSTELRPGQRIRPAMDADRAVELVESLYGFTVVSVSELDSYDDRNFHVRVAAGHCNRHVEQISPHGYLLKVMNSVDSLKPHVGKWTLGLIHTRTDRLNETRSSKDAEVARHASRWTRY